MASTATAAWVATLICLLSVVVPIGSAAAQTVQLEEDAERIIDAFAVQGVVDRETLA